jgi:replicative DNA helicase
VDYDLAEIAVLASAMRDDTGRSSACALEHLTEEDFASPDRQRIFSVLSKLAPACNDVDVMMELPELSDTVTFISQQYGGGNVERYVDHLIEHRNVRAVNRALLSAQDGVLTEKSAEEIASSFTAEVAKAFTSRKGQVHVKQAVQDAHAEFLAQDAGDFSAIPTGFSRLDSHLGGGLKNGCLYVIGARPGVGKSALAIHLAMQAARKGIRSSYASLEMSASECAGRLLANASGVARPTMQGALTAQHKTKLADTASSMKAWPITFKDDNKATLEAFGAFLQQQRLEGDLGFAVIDYLQLLSSPGFESRTQEVSAISRSLKQMANQFEIPILALSQLNRGSTRENRKPTLSDLRESGSIEQDADCVLLLDVEEELNSTTDVVWMNLAKNRNGETGQSFAEFEKPLGRFSTHVKPRLNDDKPVSPSELPW